MIEDFDKEIDALLRQSARGETASENSKFKIQNSNVSHPDADEISLFAENALPKKLRDNAVLHFADCVRCRRILSDLISQNTENEVIFDAQIEVLASEIPWYRKFFAFPNLAYTLGALVLVFSGLVMFTVLQSVNKTQNAEVSQISEQPVKGGPFLDDAAIVPEQNANTMMSGSLTTNSSLSNAASTFSPSSAMSNGSINSAVRSSNANSASSSPAVSNKTSVSKNEESKDETRSEVTVTQQAVSELPLSGRNVSNLTGEKTEPDNAKKEEQKERKNEAEAADTPKSAPRQSKQPSVSDNDVVTMGDAPREYARKRMRSDSAETTSVGGKTFKRAGNAWIDSIYKDQTTTNITRGTSEFIKLDSDSRRIAENLGGTIIIVWKDKAYRIQ